MTIGKRIQLRRKELGITVDTLALRLKKNRATIYRYENNEIEKLPTIVLEPLAKALSTTPAYLMGWTDEKNIIPISDDIMRLSTEEIILIKKWRMLDDKSRQFYTELINRDISNIK